MVYPNTWTNIRDKRLSRKLATFSQLIISKARFVTRNVHARFGERNSHTKWVCSCEVCRRQKMSCNGTFHNYLHWHCHMYTIQKIFISQMSSLGAILKTNLQLLSATSWSVKRQLIWRLTSHKIFSCFVISAPRHEKQKNADWYEHIGLPLTVSAHVSKISGYRAAHPRRMSNWSKKWSVP